MLGPETLVASSLIGPLAFALGAAVGSFLNVCILRIPAGESLVAPRSHCPRCGSLVRWHDNLPILSWLFLGGRCRSCKSHISVQYPLIELATALLWLGSVLHWGVGWDAAAAAAFGTILLGIAVTNARSFLVPDEYTIGGLFLGVALSLRGGMDGVFAAIIGAVVGFGLTMVVTRVGRWYYGEEVVGLGIVKMMAMVGAFVGWQGVMLTIFGGALLGTLIFVPMTLVLRQKKLMPFGVFLAAAAGIAFVAGDWMIRWYMGVVWR